MNAINPTPSHYPFTVRQGDVLVERVPFFPRRVALVPAVEHLVLAEGEATGHAHVLTSPACRVGRTGDEICVELTEAGVLRHEEHAPISLPPGRYRVTRQREYRPGLPNALTFTTVKD